MPPETLRIHGLCVSVNYAPHLRVSGPHWLSGLTSLTVVSTPEDRMTRRVCQDLADRFPKKSVSLYTTDVFTSNGASFNKGAAMEEARQHMPWEDWILFFDVDIVPERHWLQHLDDQQLQMGYLYSAWRLQADTIHDIGNGRAPYVPDDRPGYGYFQLFHSKDPKVQKTPLLDTHWKHAGNADSNFLLSFRSMTQTLQLGLWHFGPRHENWFGVGQEEAFKQMQETRGGQGIHPSERCESS